MKITIQNGREEALKAGFAALLDRLPHGYSFELFKEQLADWDVRAFWNGEKAVGMLMTREAELHVAVLPEVRGRWLSRRLIRETFAPILARYGQAKTSVMADNKIGLDFVRRIRAGFADLTFDPVSAGLSAVASIGGGLIQAGAAKKAANTAADASSEAVQAQLAMYNQTRADQEPWRQSGQNALLNITQAMPHLNHQFGAADLNANMAPNWRFALDQGIGATKNAANLQTGLLSGNTLKGVADYALNKSGDLYQQAFNNFTSNQSNIFNRLATIAGFGSGANQVTAGLAGQISPGISSATQAAGAARAAGTMGAANAIAGGVSNAAGWYGLSQISPAYNVASNDAYDQGMRDINAQLYAS